MKGACQGPGISRKPEFREEESRLHTRRVDSMKTNNSWTAIVVAADNGRPGSKLGGKVDATLKRLVDDR